jgi:hypothetical protein
VVAAILAAAVAGLFLLLPSDDAPVARPTPTVTPTPSPTPSPTPTVCSSPASGPFTPTTISVPGIVRNANVLALPRDGRNVPSVPPISNTGKREFAWDRPPGIKPGSAKGNVLLNAHTWPDGSALGNKLLNRLDKGERIIVRNNEAELCYEVSKRVEVPASADYPPYYDREGPPQLAIIVCSGRRLGPGNWTHRTIWFASPA